MILFGDFHANIDHSSMKRLCENDDLGSLIKEVTCFKNPQNPSCIELNLTNKLRSFIKTRVIEIETAI